MMMFATNLNVGGISAFLFNVLLKGVCLFSFIVE